MKAEILEKKIKVCLYNIENNSEKKMINESIYLLLKELSNSYYTFENYLNEELDNKYINNLSIIMSI